MNLPDMPSRILLDRHPQSPLVPDAMIAMLETYDREGKYEDVIRYSFEIPAGQLTPEQQLSKETMTGDAYLAMDSPVDAFYFYSLVYDQSPPMLKDQTLQKLKDVLPHLNTINTIYLLDLLKNEALRGHLLYHLGLLTLETGRTDDAIAALSELVKRQPAHEQAGQAKSLIRGNLFGIDFQPPFHRLPLAPQRSLQDLWPQGPAGN